MDSILEESVAEEMDALAHYGMPRRSGRYPWGSGQDPYQHTRDLLSRVEELKKTGWKETPENIEKEFGLTTNQYRAQKALAGNLRRLDKVKRAESLKEDGLNNSEIGRKMGIPESTVRSLLDVDRKERMMKAMTTADFIRERINSKGPVDIGAEVNRELGVSREKMNEAIAILESEGYVIRGGRVPEPNNPGKMTTLKLICPPDTPKNAAYDLENIHSLTDYVSQDGGDTFRKKFTYPTSLDGKRLMVRYVEDGGDQKDGIIELRRNVEDLSLGGDHYAQVRIMVNGTHYLKGMAIYSDDMPPGVDVIFNTNKSRDVPVFGDKKNSVLKPIKKDPDNPFGSAIKDVEQGGQYWYKDKRTGEMKLGLINKRAGEGDWSEWKDAVPSQFLSKQPLATAKKQLKMAMNDKQMEFDDIMALNNPTVKKHFLQKFADECDSAAKDLQAAAFPGQKYRVIIPISSLKDTEVYAPTYPDGSQLALIRYPHGGQFEIPILKVNNKHKESRRILGTDITDAVAINKKVADRLSGADFDGDTVMCIPTHDPAGKVKIHNKNPLKGLEGFDNKLRYGCDPSATKVDPDGTEHYFRNGREFKVMKNTQTEMGKISNLITDMTLRGASDDDLAAAVRHSMVVIDAEKHHLDYKASEVDNGIARLRKEYQDGGGASTLISKAKGQHPVPKRKGTPIINVPDAVMIVNGKKVSAYDPSRPEGSLIWKTADDLNYTVAKISARSKDAPNATVRASKSGSKYVEYDDSPDWVKIDGKTDLPVGSRVVATNKTKTRTQVSTHMAETDDARTLISSQNTAMERAYADYANSMKAMANRARVEMVNTGKVAFSASAKQTYAAEVKSLMEKLDTARLNAPKERMAKVKTQAEISAKRKANPDMSKDEIKKLTQQALVKYRNQLGSVARRDRSIKITDREWEAIQAGAIYENKLVEILNNTDVDSLRQRATPRASNTLSSAKISRIKSYQSSNYTAAEIAKKIGVSVSTVEKYLKGGN